MLKLARNWHLWLVYPALISGIVYVVSAFCHPLMAWTGPQTAVMFPPAMQVSAQDFQQLPKVIGAHNLEHARVAKFVPYQDQNLLQITEGDKAPRRYFHTQTLEEWAEHDQQQAIWLAQHYLKKELPIERIEFVTEFSSDYPSVNRLLPVYKIHYATDDELTILIHTETQAVAAITNQWKQTLVTLFQWFHTFTWLDDYEVIRVVLSMILLAVLVVSLVSGGLLLLKIKRKKTDTIASRRWHRRIAWLLWIPFMMFLSSGIYHLLHWTDKPEHLGIRLTENLPLRQWQTEIADSSELSTLLADQLADRSLHQVSLVSYPEAKNKDVYLYRLSVATSNHAEHNSRAKRFSGRAAEQDAIYLTTDGKLYAVQDEMQLITQQAQSLLSEDDQVTQLTKVTRFGVNYDFRNKRLPVWQVDTLSGTRLFIDPVGHSLIDQNQMADRVEQFSFSYFHKWNFLLPLMDRKVRDGIIMLSLALLFGLFLLGWWRYTRLKPAKAIKHPAQTNLSGQTAQYKKAS